MSEDNRELTTSDNRTVVKSDKTTILKRVQEVLRLLLAGGEFDDIRQYASTQGWGVSDRQLRRYQERAYRKLAGATTRDHKQLLGRHLMQRRALYARAIKGNDFRGALAVLKDEAALEGLYDRTEEPEVASPTEKSIVDRRKRLCELVNARLDEDEEEVRLIEMTSPVVTYNLVDVRLAEMTLHTLTLLHVTEQLDHAAMLMMSFWRTSVDCDKLEFWTTIGSLHAWNFHVGAEGWRKFAEDLGVNSKKLIRAACQTSLLDLFEEQIHDVCPERAEIEAMLENSDQNSKELTTADDVAQSWHRLLNEVLEK